MYRVLLTALLSTSSFWYTDLANSNRTLRPLWEEEKHFCHYRTLCLEGSVNVLQQVLKKIKEHPENEDQLLEQMDGELNNCQYALGFYR